MKTVNASERISFHVNMIRMSVPFDSIPFDSIDEGTGAVGKDPKIFDF